MDWNIEHMNSWWTGGRNPVLRDTFQGNNFSPSIDDVPALARRCAEVIRAVDPDVVTLQEAAGLPELHQFFDEFVGGGPWSIARGSGGGQALAVAARTDRSVTALAVGSSSAGSIDLSESIHADVNADLVVDEQPFARDPQVVVIEAHGQEILLVNNHLKSKFVVDGQRMWEAGGEDRLAFIADALVARRRISAEAYRIREFIDTLLEEDDERLLLVTGDLNDGAGSDFFEQNYLTHSVVDRIFGSVFSPERQLTHVLFNGDALDWTARFHDFIADEERDLVLDHIGLSPALADWRWAGRVAVSEYEAQVVPDAERERERLPSDHRPVVVDVEPPQ